LEAKRFDLAVDLRKGLSTRDVLQRTGARFLAGFDYQGQCPYLDIVVEWDGDRALQRKRTHVADDLLLLVAAIGRAALSERAVFQTDIAPIPRSALPAPAGALFDRPVVAVHPGAGNTTKQWPEEYFSALIDLLIEREDVNVLLIGGPDEVEIADALARNVLYPDRVASIAGRTSLADLPSVIAGCVLYVGNDSGPKHVAAAIGIPVIGIHSGVVDAAEWGPLGPCGVAMQRNMTCAPCYLASAAECPRELACLRGLEVSHVYDVARLLLMRPVPPGQARRPAARFDDQEDCLIS
jgi:ADP-heptose:LPS heptosyltransferase